MKPIVLASASPRRAELLRQLGLEFSIMASDVTEDFPDRPAEPVELVKSLALLKAQHVASHIAVHGREAIIIGADTVVVMNGRTLEKPKSPAEAGAMLRMLSGREHSVLTGLALCELPGDRSQVTCTETKVKFRDLAPGEIHAYLATGEPFDKAGAYGIQGKGAALVEGITGCYFNVVGLPLGKLVLMLRDFGGSVWGSGE